MMIIKIIIIMTIIIIIITGLSSLLFHHNNETRQNAMPLDRYHVLAAQLKTGWVFPVSPTPPPISEYEMSLISSQ
jgi:hypothetical protein